MWIEILIETLAALAIGITYITTSLSIYEIAHHFRFDRYCLPWTPPGHPNYCKSIFASGEYSNATHPLDIETSYPSINVSVVLGMTGSGPEYWTQNTTQSVFIMRATDGHLDWWQNGHIAEMPIITKVVRDVESESVDDKPENKEQRDYLRTLKDNLAPHDRVEYVNTTVHHNGTYPEQWDDDLLSGMLILQTPDGVDADIWFSYQTRFNILLNDSTKLPEPGPVEPDYIDIALAFFAIWVLILSNKVREWCPPMNDLGRALHKYPENYFYYADDLLIVLMGSIFVWEAIEAALWLLGNPGGREQTPKQVQPKGTSIINTLAQPFAGTINIPSAAWFRSWQFHMPTVDLPTFMVPTFLVPTFNIPTFNVPRVDVRRCIPNFRRRQIARQQTARAQPQSQTDSSHPPALSGAHLLLAHPQQRTPVPPTAAPVPPPGPPEDPRLTHSIIIAFARKHHIDLRNPDKWTAQQTANGPFAHLRESKELREARAEWKKETKKLHGRKKEQNRKATRAAEAAGPRASAGPSSRVDPPMDNGTGSANNETDSDSDDDDIDGEGGASKGGCAPSRDKRNRDHDQDPDSDSQDGPKGADSKIPQQVPTKSRGKRKNAKQKSYRQQPSSRKQKRQSYQLDLEGTFLCEILQGLPDGSLVDGQNADEDRGDEVSTPFQGPAASSPKAEKPQMSPPSSPSANTGHEAETKGELDSPSQDPTAEKENDNSDKGSEDGKADDETSPPEEQGSDPGTWFSESFKPLASSNNGFSGLDTLHESDGDNAGNVVNDKTKENNTGGEASKAPSHYTSSDESKTPSISSSSDTTPTHHDEDSPKTRSSISTPEPHSDKKGQDSNPETQPKTEEALDASNTTCSITNEQPPTAEEESSAVPQSVPLDENSTAPRSENSASDPPTRSPHDASTETRVEEPAIDKKSEQTAKATPASISKIPVDQPPSPLSHVPKEMKDEASVTPQCSPSPNPPCGLKPKDSSSLPPFNAFPDVQKRSIPEPPAQLPSYPPTDKPKSTKNELPSATQGRLGSNLPDGSKVREPPPIPTSNPPHNAQNGSGIKPEPPVVQRSDPPFHPPVGPKSNGPPFRPPYDLSANAPRGPKQNQPAWHPVYHPSRGRPQPSRFPQPPPTPQGPAYYPPTPQGLAFYQPKPQASAFYPPPPPIQPYHGVRPVQRQWDDGYIERQGPPNAGLDPAEQWRNTNAANGVIWHSDREQPQPGRQQGGFDSNAAMVRMGLANPTAPVTPPAPYISQQGPGVQQRAPATPRRMTPPQHPSPLPPPQAPPTRPPATPPHNNTQLNAAAPPFQPPFRPSQSNNARKNAKKAAKKAAMGGEKEENPNPEPPWQPLYWCAANIDCNNAYCKEGHWCLAAHSQQALPGRNLRETCIKGVRCKHPLCTGWHPSPRKCRQPIFSDQRWKDWKIEERERRQKWWAEFGDA